ncbi:MAG: hypothetical protein JSV04_04770, partial [Candidatus Heimdallarchaeota archaeon]
MKDLSDVKNYAFKESMKDIIPPVNYLTHNIYSYPAKFIPHVPRYVVSKFMREDNGVVFDPFAGSSSTAIEALCLGHNCICIDINPLTDFLTKVKTQRITFNLYQKTPMKLDSFLKKDKKSNLDLIDVEKFIKKMRRNNEFFSPKWKNVDHWYPEEFKNLISNIWGFIHSIEGEFPEDFLNLVK